MDKELKEMRKAIYEQNESIYKGTEVTKMNQTEILE